MTSSTATAAPSVPESDKCGPLRGYAVPVEMVPQLWPTVARDVMRAASRAEEGWTPEVIFDHLQRGRVFLHVAFRGEEYAGCCLSYPMDFPNGRALYIWFVGGKPGLVAESLPYMKDQARTIGANRITYARWKKRSRANKLGFRPTYTSYRMEV